jgi:HAD superfamily hydrolase (TIGR01662 family)
MAYSRASASRPPRSAGLSASSGSAPEGESVSHRRILRRRSSPRATRIVIPTMKLVSSDANQARVSKGEISEAEVLRRFAWANERLGRPFTAWLLCPHDDADGCACRKPKPGMFLDLAARHHLDLAASTHVGDSEKDRDAARAAGVGEFVWAREFFRW